MALLSKGRISRMMLDILLEFPSGAKNLKENVKLLPQLPGVYLYKDSKGTVIYGRHGHL